LTVDDMGLRVFAFLDDEHALQSEIPDGQEIDYRLCTVPSGGMQARHESGKGGIVTKL